MSYMELIRKVLISFRLLKGCTRLTISKIKFNLKKLKKNIQKFPKKIKNIKIKKH